MATDVAIAGKAEIEATGDIKRDENFWPPTAVFSLEAKRTMCRLALAIVLVGNNSEKNTPESRQKIQEENSVSTVQARRPPHYTPLLA